IDGTVYLLAATQKELHFGMLPYHCLNYYGRVMDMDKGSYWQDIHREKVNGKLVRLELELELDAQLGTGNYRETSQGHDALRKRELLKKLGTKEYLEAMEAGAQGEFYIEAHR